MITNITVMNLGERKQIMVNTETDTPKTCFEKAGIDYASGQMMLNGLPVTARDFNEPLDTFGCTGGTLSAIVKADSATE